MKLAHFEDSVSKTSNIENCKSRLSNMTHRLHRQKKGDRGVIRGGLERLFTPHFENISTSCMAKLALQDRF